MRQKASKRRYDHNYEISCLPTKDTQSIIRFVSPIDSCRFVIPFISTEQIELLDVLKTLVPFKYIVYGKEFIITSVDYNVANDYIIAQFKK